MSKVAFKQCDVERALRAAKAVGNHDAVVDIRPDGTLRLLPRPPADEEPPASDLDAWERKHGLGGA